MVNGKDVYSARILEDIHLIYAPFHGLLALVNSSALQAIREALLSPNRQPHETVKSIVDTLRSPGIPIPRPASGPLDDPLFLGIIPTRGCNLACRYCDFPAPKNSSPAMDLYTARDAVDAYLELLERHGKKHAEIHFFGGEPFFAAEVVHFVVGHARLQAAQNGIEVRFETITNGMFNRATCQWIGDNFDTVVLSLDGAAEVQNFQRPSITGAGTFDTVSRNARILSESPVELILRACVTRATVSCLPEIVAWIGQEFRPSTVCFEALTPTHAARESGLETPDPWTFGRQFLIAERVLEGFGIRAELSTANLDEPRIYFCPVGRDALIVSPRGAVDACYLLENEWAEKGLNMRLGYLYASGPDCSQKLAVDRERLRAIRALHVENRPLCSNCLCRYHCAGGCHVNHDTSRPPGNYSDVCIQTRLVTIARLLKKIGRQDLLDTWMADRSALQKSIFSAGDRLLPDGVSL